VQREEAPGRRVHDQDRPYCQELRDAFLSFVDRSAQPHLAVPGGATPRPAAGDRDARGVGGIRRQAGRRCRRIRGEQQGLAAGRKAPPSPALPGSTHDRTAAWQHRIYDALAGADVKCWTNKAYQGAGRGVRVPFRVAGPAASLRHGLRAPGSERVPGCGGGPDRHRGIGGDPKDPLSVPVSNFRLKCAGRRGFTACGPRCRRSHHRCRRLECAQRRR
jgi:hypothetical protein